MRSFQGPGESNIADRKYSSRLLKLLHELRKKAGLSSSDVKKAEQFISTSIDIEQIRNGVLKLYQELDPFDVKQAKIASVYAELDQIIRDGALTDTPPQPSLTSKFIPEPLPVSPQPELAIIEADSPITPDLQDRITDLLSDIRRQTKGNPVAKFSFSKQLLLIKRLIRERVDWNTLQHTLDMALEQTRQIESYFERLRNAVESEYHRDLAIRSGIKSLLRQLNDQLVKDSDKGLRLWYQSYAFCLSEWQLDRCLRLADKAVRLPDIILLVYSAASKYLAEGNYAAPEVDHMLKHLIETLQTDTITEELTLAKLHVLHGRIHLYHRESPETAQNLFEAAQQLCPYHELPRAAMGEFYLSQSDYKRAEAQFKKGLKLPPDLIDSYLGLGRLHEQRERWEKANEWYDRAADVALRDSDAVALPGKLLAPVSGNAYLCLAFKLAADRPEPALQAVTRALALGIRGKSNYPEAEAFRLKAEMLEQLGRKEEAREAFSQAGQCFSWRYTSDDNEKARQCFEAAIRLGSPRVSDSWQLADVYLSLSYDGPDNETKRGYVERGITVWNAAARQELPDESFHWAYAARAGLADRRAVLLRGKDWRKRIDLWWQASVMMERLLLITDTRALDWSFLSRPFNSLYLYQNALKAAKKAFELDSEMLFVAEWRLIVLCDAGHLEEAIPLIEHRLKVNDDPWTYSIRAWVKLHQERYQEAKNDIARAYANMEQEQLSIWDLNLRAGIYASAKDWDLAKKDWEAIYLRRDEQDINNLDSYANAAFYLGKREEAMQLLQTPILLQDPIARITTLQNLGLFQVLCGQTDEGWKNIEEGISLGVETRSLNFYLAECKEKLSPQEADRVASLVRARVKVLEQPKKCVEELIEAYGTFSANEHDNSWVRVGIQASLARVYREEGQWVEAANLYKQLLALEFLLDDDMPPFPEARRGLELCVGKIEQFGEEAFKAGQANEAIRHYEHALQLDEDISRDIQTQESITRTAGLHAKLALAMLDTEDVRAASNPLAAALNLCRQVEDPDPVKKLADLLKPMLRNGAHYWQMHDALNLLTGDQNNPGTLRHDIATLNKMMASYLEDRYGLSIKQSDILMVLPIILEIGDELIPEDTSTENWSLFTRLIPEMRNRIKEEMGVTTAGIRVRHLSSVPSKLPSYSDYRILLDEILVMDGKVRLDRKFCPQNPDEIESAGITIDKQELAENPRTGAMGYWLDEESASQAVEHKLEIWDEPLEYVIQRLEAVLRRNLANFLGIQEVETILESHAETAEGEQQIASALPDRQARLHFARLLRTLVKENTPISNIGEILQAFRELQLNSGNLDEAVRQIRLQNKSILPGNRPVVQRFELPRDWEEMINEWVRMVDGKKKFTPPPDKAHDLIQEIDRLVPSPNRHSVLVVHNHQTRPFLRRLLENRFPGLMVMSAEELVEVAVSENESKQ